MGWDLGFILNGNLGEFGIGLRILRIIKVGFGDFWFFQFWGFLS
jgi:hypothetical protein